MAAFGGAAAPPEDGAAVAPEAGEEEDLEFDDWLVQELKDLSLDVEVRREKTLERTEEV